MIERKRNYFYIIFVYFSDIFLRVEGIFTGQRRVWSLLISLVEVKLYVRPKCLQYIKLPLFIVFLIFQGKIFM